MTDNELNTKVAKVIMGWEHREYGCEGMQWFERDEHGWTGPALLPNYATDAIHARGALVVALALMAAAPDLLEACEAALNLLSWDDDRIKTIIAVMSTLESAIAKAKGAK